MMMIKKTINTLIWTSSIMTLLFPFVLVIYVDFIGVGIWR